MRILLILAVLAATVPPALAHEEKSEHLTISHPWTRATAPTQKTGVVYMEISANASKPDRLIGAFSPDAEITQIHGMQQDGDILRMRTVEAVEIPAEGKAELKPGGTHIMLIGLKAPLFEETVIPLTLTFERAGKVEIEAVVEAPAARAASSPGQEKSGMHSGHGR
jgi:copper(I)-binding protein